MKLNTISMNVPFAKADLASHVLLMCPYRWQDQSNLHKKGGTLVDMRSLLLSLEAKLSVYVARKDPKDLALFTTRKHCTVRKRVQSDLVLKLQPESQRKLVPRNTATFARSTGARTRHTILEIAVGLRKTEQKIQFSHRKERRKETQSHKAVFRAVKQENGLA